MTSNRLEAFSDGVIAVIITIMVLELHVPHQDGLIGLWSVAPRFGVYVMSFMMVGIYWINHHELLRRTEEVDQKILWANLIFLLMLSVIPFFVDYLDEKLFSTFATILYEIAMIFAGIAFLFLRWSVMRRQARGGKLQKADEKELHKHWISLGIYAIALPIAFYHSWLSLAFNVFVTLLWIVPRLERSAQPQDAC
jgi:uncharacterized membrane protein